MQAGNGAHEFVCKRAFGIESFGRNGSRNHQFHTAVVQHVHQQREAARHRGHRDLHVRNVGNHDGLEHGGQFQIIVLRQRFVAQFAKVKPRHMAGTLAHGDLARAYLHVGCSGHFCRRGKLGEDLLHLVIGLGLWRNDVRGQVFQRPLAVIHAMIHIDDHQALLEQFNGRQDPVAVQAIGIQGVWLEVGRGHKAHAVVKQGLQQPVQDHRVGHVCHVEFVEADQLEALGHFCAQCLQRIDGALQLAQFVVHFAHEFVKVQACLALDRYGLVETVHQEALAATHAAVHVYAAWNVRAVDELLDRVGSLLLVGRPFVRAMLQRGHGLHLRRIALEAARGKFPVVNLFNGSHISYCRAERPRRACGEN